MITWGKNQIRKPILRYGLMTMITPDIESTTITHALTDERWCRAMSNEFDAQICNRTWNLVPASLAPNLANEPNLIGVSVYLKLNSYLMILLTGYK